MCSLPPPVLRERLGTKLAGNGNFGQGMTHERKRPTADGRGIPGGHPENTLKSACRHLRGGSRTIPSVDGEPRSVRSTREGRALWRWGKENACCLKSSDYLSRITGGGQEHRVWHNLKQRRYWKATHAGRYGWVARLDFRYNKYTQEDEPFIGMGEALPLEYLDRLILQNRVFSDNIRLENCAVEKDGLVILPSQAFVKGRKPRPAAILQVMLMLRFERIPGIPANSETASVSIGVRTKLWPSTPTREILSRWTQAKWFPSTSSWSGPVRRCIPIFAGGLTRIADS